MEGGGWLGDGWGRVCQYSPVFGGGLGRVGILFSEFQFEKTKLKNLKFPKNKNYFEFP